ncbi:MAG: preprotein translocase subunit YajC [Planctomycetes bacterium]|nr:preprotein translocase subunit YajC [Planctomycetota bacterium]
MPTGSATDSFFQFASKVSEVDINLLLLLAEEGMLPSLFGGNMWVPLSIIMVLFYFMILRPQKNKEQSFRSMIDNLKEKDRVVTVGGVHGVVTNVQRDRDEVTVRVDESTGTKIRFSTSAITRVVTDEDKKEKKK